MQQTPDPASRAALPFELTSFIGREHETAELHRLLASNRLLTLTGAGGSGKTRLAREVIRQLDGDVAWVELAAVNDPANIAQHIAKACGIGDEIRAGDTQLLARLLANRSLLLVLDNCEHLVDACAAIADSLLRASDALRILATSREALGVKGERAWLVPQLPSEDAIALFVERARDFGGTFELTEQNASAVAEIARRLDGIPLAIELAAARVRVLSPQQVRDRLDDAFSLLKSSARTVVPRHRTLQAAIDWSYALLSDDERIFFQRIAAFRGGFTLDAVDAVAAGGPIAQDDVLDLLSSLVDRSLVAVREQDGSARYTLLETVLQYARQKLGSSAEVHDVRRRHAEHFMNMVAEAEPHFIRTERPVWINRLAADLENIREALSWSRAHDPALHIRLAGMLWWFWYSTRLWTEAGRILNDALTLPEAAQQNRERGKLLFAAGALSALQARVAAARPLLEEAIAIAADVDDAQLVAYARNYLGMSYAGAALPEAKELCRASARWFEENNDPYGHRLALLLLASSALAEGEPAQAAEFSAPAVRIARTFARGRELSIALHVHAVSFIMRGNFDEARRHLIESLAASREDSSYFAIANALDGLAEIEGHQGRPLRAARLMGAAAQLRAVIGAVPFKFHQARLEAALPSFRDAAGRDAFERARAEGMQLTADQVLDEVLGETVFPLPAPVATTERGIAQVQLRVRALGPLQVEVNGDRLSDDAWSYAKPKELLVYLLCHPDGSTRDRIARALWPAATPAQLKNSFHVTLHHLRKGLCHGEWIVVESDRYRIARNVTCEFDGDVFERAARELLHTNDRPIPRLREVLALYRGELLDGEVTADWLVEHADRFHRLQLELSLVLAHDLASSGDTTSAIKIYEAIVAKDDLQEEAQRGLIAGYARLGDRERAVRQYERLAEALNEALDSEPEPETVALYERIRAERVAAS